MGSTVIDTVASIADLVDKISNRPSSPPALYLDLEGNNLSRHGTLSIVTLLLYPENDVYLVDVTTLGRRAFSTKGTKGQTLKSILESNKIGKIIFDVRHDSDALYSHFQVNLGGTLDLQLMELATRNFPKRCVNGLSKCIENESSMTATERAAWKKTKEKGIRLFDPKLGGSYGVFDVRPLSTDIKSYCEQDVTCLPNLWFVYSRKISSVWMRRVEEETKARIQLSQSASFDGRGRHMALGPPKWRYASNFDKPDRSHMGATTSALRGRVAAPELVNSSNTSANTSSDSQTKVADHLRPCHEQRSSKEKNDVKSPSTDVLSEVISKLKSLEFGSLQGSSHVALSGTAKHLDSDDDDNNNNNNNNSEDSDDTDSESPRDYTACSADDCGYCGHCDY